MKKTSIDKLYFDFPDLFKQASISCGDGWEPIIRDMAEKLNPIANGTKITQIKEKFGGMSVYMNYTTDEIENIVCGIEKISRYTCEECGQPGTVKGKQWLYAACSEHTKVEDRVEEFNKDVKDILTGDTC